MNEFELVPTNGRKSFNGKAIVKEQRGLRLMESYGTLVAEYNCKTDEMKVYGWFSATTAIHINHFLSYCGFDKCSKKELMDYNA